MANSQYVFCPLCGAKLEEQARYGAVRGVCPTCGFIHFADPKVAVIGLVHHQGRVLLAKRAVDPAKGKWALPGGFMDAGEMPEAALSRELMEEVGMAIQVERLLEIFPMTGPRAGEPRDCAGLSGAAQPRSAPGFGGDGRYRRRGLVLAERSARRVGFRVHPNVVGPFWYLSKHTGQRRLSRPS